MSDRDKTKEILRETTDTAHHDGFSQHMRADHARSAVVYMEQEDPKRRHREKVVCALNLGDFELRYPANPTEPEKTVEDGRTLRRAMWDESVQALMQILGGSGLNPKFVRNDKNSCRLVVRQECGGSEDSLPDEFYEFELYYCSEFELERRKLEYVKRIDRFADQIRELRGRLHHWLTPKQKREGIRGKIEDLEKEKAFFIATTPDPREMDSGLIFRVEINTTKEFGVLKNKLRVILSRYIEALSRIASSRGASLPANLRRVA